MALGREFEALGVGLVVIDQAVDTTTPVGRLLFHVLGAIAEFERDLIRDRVVAGLRRAQERGTRSGRPIGRPRRELDSGDVRCRRAAGEPWAPNREGCQGAYPDPAAATGASGASIGAGESRGNLALPSGSASSMGDSRIL